MKHTACLAKEEADKEARRIAREQAAARLREEAAQQAALASQQESCATCQRQQSLNDCRSNRL
ncbi:MAG: hypothetical protein U1E99_00025 [Agitococcus sp.]